MEIESTVVQPRRISPYAFSAGKNVISYTYNLKGGVSVTCPVTIIVKGEHNHGRIIVKSVVEHSMKYSIPFLMWAYLYVSTREVSVSEKCLY